MKKFYFLVLLISLASLWPFFRTGYFESHDGEWMVIRFTAFHQTLASGQFPVRFVDRLNNNYGYPVLNFLYPLPFYLAEIPKLAGFGFVSSVKIVFVLSTIVSSLGMFWALSQVFSKEASFAGAALYLFAPYRFVDLYVRGSIGENLAFAIIPLILGALFKIAKKSKIFLPILSFLTGFLILSHNVIAVIFLPLFVIISIVLIKRDSIVKVFAAFLVGFLIATFFWLPAIYDLRFVRLSQIKVSNITDHVVSLDRLIIPSWDYGPSPRSADELSTQIGIVSIAVVISALIIRFAKGIKHPLTDVLLAIFFASAFLMTKFSAYLWQNIPYMDIMQFPWRLLSMTVFISAFLASYVIETNKKRNILALLIVLAAIISTIVYTKPRAFVDRPDTFYSTNEDTTTVKDEYLPLWVKENPKGRADQKIVVGQESTVLREKIAPANYQATIFAKQDSPVQINTIYFPGHSVSIDGRETVIDYQNNHGLITFQLPKGEYQVIIRYTKTPIHLFSEIISLVATIGTVAFLFSTMKSSKSLNYYG